MQEGRKKEGRQEGRKKEGRRKEGRKEGRRKEGRKEGGRKEGRKECVSCWDGGLMSLISLRSCCLIYFSVFNTCLANKLHYCVNFDK
jgi:hypothetical protein